MLIIFYGCNKNDVFLKDIDRFVSDVELNYKEYSEEDWLTKDKEFTAISGKQFEKLRERLSDEEISRANELMGKYKALKLKKGLIDIKTGIKDLFEQSKGVVKEPSPDSSEINRLNINTETSIRNTQIKEGEKQDSAVYHIIQKGDTYDSIAELYWGTDKEADEIEKLNPGIDYRKLKIGQKIRVK